MVRISLSPGRMALLEDRMKGPLNSTDGLSTEAPLPNGNSTGPTLFDSQNSNSRATYQIGFGGTSNQNSRAAASREASLPADGPSSKRPRRGKAPRAADPLDAPDPAASNAAHSNASAAEGQSPGRPNNRSILDFFGRNPEQSPTPQRADPLEPGAPLGASSGAENVQPAPAGSPGAAPEPGAPLPPSGGDKLRRQVQALQLQLEKASGDLRAAQQRGLEARRECDTLRSQLSEVEASARRASEGLSKHQALCSTVVRELVRKAAVSEARAARERAMKASLRLGRLATKAPASASGRLEETWVDGYGAEELRDRQAALQARREEVERLKKELSRQRKALSKAQGERMKELEGQPEARRLRELAEPTDDAGVLERDHLEAHVAHLRDAERRRCYVEELSLTEEEETLRMALAGVRVEEQRLGEDARALQVEKVEYVAELKRQRHEDRSRFRTLPALRERYQLVALLGKGGFSEVWRAFDLLELREVAVKVHQLHKEWSDERKRNYTRHATREYEIHSNMSHPRVVRLFDVFEIDMDSFATVLEHCRGEDLDRRLKKHGSIAERDARTWLLQILSGLKYLNTPGEGRGAIIHYDLKPGNILFDEAGDVKITDFGLSKIIKDDDGAESLELTSQGAGTYWYLPPECFQRGPNPPRISSKVDVFSIGVIYYQMLFGRRPFGDGMTQDQLFSNGTMLRISPKDLRFPDKPAVSTDAKDFIRTCLQPSQVDRPDIITLCAHPYLRRTQKRG